MSFGGSSPSPLTWPAFNLSRGLQLPDMLANVGLMTTCAALAPTESDREPPIWYSGSSEPLWPAARSWAWPDINSLLRYRDVLLQREIKKGFTRDFHLVTLGDDLRTCAYCCAGCGADACSFAPTGHGTDDCSHCRCSERSLGRGFAARLARQTIFPRHHGHGLPIYHNPR